MEYNYETIVLGGGPVGIAIGALLKAPVVTDLVRIPRGPVYLYDNADTRRFLEAIHKGWGVPKNVHIGFCYKGKVSSELSEQARLEYSLKTKRESEFRPTKFKYLPVDWAEVIVYARRYIPKVHIDEVWQIDVEGHKLKAPTGNVYNYENLISTIPAPIFTKLAGVKWDLDFIGVEMRNADPPLLGATEWKDWTKYDYVYVCDIDEPIMRWARNHNSKSIDGTVERIVKAGNGFNQYKIIDGGVKDVEDVTFMGRFGQWKEERFIHDDIRDCFRELMI